MLGVTKTTPKFCSLAYFLTVSMTLLLSTTPKPAYFAKNYYY